MLLLLGLRVSTFFLVELDDADSVVVNEGTSTAPPVSSVPERIGSARRAPSSTVYM